MAGITTGLHCIRVLPLTRVVTSSNLFLYGLGFGGLSSLEFADDVGSDPFVAGWMGVVSADVWLVCAKLLVVWLALGLLLCIL